MKKGDGIFRVTREKDVFNPAWPEYIPSCCSECGEEMSVKVNLSKGRSKLAEKLRWVAPWLSVVMMVLLLAVMAFVLDEGFNGGQGSSMSFVAMIVGPPVVLTIVANCLPKRYRVHCHKCNGNYEFRIRN